MDECELQDDGALTGQAQVSISVDRWSPALDAGDDLVGAAEVAIGGGHAVDAHVGALEVVALVVASQLALRVGEAVEPEQADQLLLERAVQSFYFTAGLWVVWTSDRLLDRLTLEERDLLESISWNVLLPSVNICLV